MGGITSGLVFWVNFTHIQLIISFSLLVDGRDHKLNQKQDVLHPQKLTWITKMMVRKRWTPLKHVFFDIYVRFLGDLICIRPKYQNSPDKLENQRMNQNSLLPFPLFRIVSFLKAVLDKVAVWFHWFQIQKDLIDWWSIWSINRLIFRDQEELAKAKAMLKGKMLRQVDEVASAEGFVLCRGVESEFCFPSFKQV